MKVSSATHSPVVGQTSAGLTVRSLAPFLLVAFMGMALIFIAGFAGSEAVHAAAHDLRHASGFPCH